MVQFVFEYFIITIGKRLRLILGNEFYWSVNSKSVFFVCVSSDGESYSKNSTVIIVLSVSKLAVRYNTFLAVLYRKKKTFNNLNSKM